MSDNKQKTIDLINESAKVAEKAVDISLEIAEHQIDDSGASLGVIQLQLGALISLMAGVAAAMKYIIENTNEEV